VIWEESILIEDDFALHLTAITRTPDHQITFSGLAASAREVTILVTWLTQHL
jgi:hypothetical protein